MSKKNDTLRLIKSKLDDIVKCVYDKAAKDDDFLKQLQNVLLNDPSQMKKKATKKKEKGEEVFNAVDFLQKNGEEKLRLELDTLTDKELQDILKSKGKKKESKFDRKMMIEEIVKYSKQQLGQGIEFLKKNVIKPRKNMVKAEDGAEKKDKLSEKDTQKKEMEAENGVEKKDKPSEKDTRKKEAESENGVEKKDKDTQKKKKSEAKNDIEKKDIEKKDIEKKDIEKKDKLSKETRDSVKENLKKKTESNNNKDT